MRTMPRDIKQDNASLDRRTLLRAVAAAAVAAPMGVFGAQAFPFRSAAPGIDFSEFPICKTSSDAPPLTGAPRKLKLSWNAGAVCLAETQRAGRGRQNRKWVSACGRSLCLSLLWRFSRGPDALGGLGLSIGLAVLRAVDDIGVEGAGLKWPNDVLWRGAKLAGSLIELSGESGGSACAVIGVGVNIDLPREAGQDIDQPWTDLATACDGEVSRNRFAGRLIHRLAEALADFDRSGLGVFLDEWGRRDLLFGQEVSVHTLAGVESGVARGVDAGGALLVESGGRVRRHLAGDVSVRSKAGARRPP